MNILEHVKTVLAQNEKFCKDGKLFKNTVVEAALKLDNELLAMLISDETIKKNFFTEVETVLVFDKVKFQKFISNKQFLPDSYTAFKNRIGLTANDEYLTEAKEVVLAWPYKDCVLEGGQTKESQKRKEIFWNETLAPDAIDRLFEPKVLSNWKRYNKEATQEVKSISINDSFILKGNNLIALHALKKVYKEKIKLIYIDPPYNTGGDGFNYNDSFNHSAWLTFMKNRLEVAKELLSKDGIIYISCDDRENAYLKVLCDAIFGREHFITNLIWRKKAGGGNDSQAIAIEHEYILAYRKQYHGIYKMPLDDKTLSSYKYKDNKFETHGGYKTKDLNDPSLSDSPGLHFDIVCPDGTVLKGDDHQWKCNKSTFVERLKDDRIVFKKVKDQWRVHYKIYLNEEKGKLKYDDKGKIIPKGRNLSSILYRVALNKDGNNDIKKIFKGKKPFSYPKPVSLIETLILSATKDNDIILDFFAGSGTTGEAVVKINAEQNTNRKFILIEQLEYIEHVTVHRVKESLNLYHSDKDFVYFELAEVNQNIISKIEACSSVDALIEVYKSLVNSNSINYLVTDPIPFDDLENLGLDKAKRMLFELIDKNNWYIPLSEMKNQDYVISDESRHLTRQFYNL